MSELAAKFARRRAIEDGEAAPSATGQVFNPYTEFKELSRKEIKEYTATFKKYDVNKDGLLDLQELKYLMEKLGHPQTHISLKAMIKEVDEDNDGHMSLREFMLVFVRATRGELVCAGLTELASSVDVAEEGVGGAKSFFEAHAKAQEKDKKNEEEIRAEQEERRTARAEAAARKKAFKEKASMFN